MKKWMYLIFPGILLGLFLTFYLTHTKEVEAREKVRLEAMARKQQEDADKKKADEQRARLDAQKNAEIRAAEDAKKEADKLAKQAAIDKEVADATNNAVAEAAASQKEIDRMTAELESLHRQRDQLTRDAFELSKKVEAAKVDRRTAELEIQRTYEIISRRTAEGFLTRMPPAAPTPPKN